MELRDKNLKRRSYDFAQLKNIEGKIISSRKSSLSEKDKELEEENKKNNTNCSSCNNNNNTKQST